VHLSPKGGIPIGKSLGVETVETVGPEGIIAVSAEATVEVGTSVAVAEVEMNATKVEVVKGADEILSAEAPDETADPPPGKHSSKKRSSR